MLNAANEISVAAFLADEIPFPRIAAVNEAVLGAHTARASGGLRDLDDVMQADVWARARAREALAS